MVSCNSCSETGWCVSLDAWGAKPPSVRDGQDLIETMADAKGFKVTVYPSGREIFEVGDHNIGILLHSSCDVIGSVRA